jgi:hypothetical protein
MSAARFQKVAYFLLAPLETFRVWRREQRGPVWLDWIGLIRGPGASPGRSTTAKIYSKMKAPMGPPKHTAQQISEIRNRITVLRMSWLRSVEAHLERQKSETQTGPTNSEKETPQLRTIEVRKPRNGAT